MTDATPRPKDRCSVCDGTGIRPYPGGIGIIPETVYVPCECPKPEEPDAD